MGAIYQAGQREKQVLRSCIPSNRPKEQVNQSEAPQSEYKCDGELVKLWCLSI